MYSSIVRDSEYKARLLAFVQDEYGVEINSISPARRGFYGETWKIGAGNAYYFLKLIYSDEYKAAYERSFPIISHLCGCGIDFIGDILKTKSGKLSTRFDSASVGIFNWVEGENIQTDGTKIIEYQMLAKIYKQPYDGLDILREDFSSGYSDELWERWRTLENGQIRFLLEKNRAKIERRAKRLSLFSKLCRGDMTGFVITHGDAGGNFFTGGGRYYIFDWDGVTLAPPERDAWAACGYEWARDAFRGALSENGIDRALRPERLAYYCYRFFFFYLNSFIAAGTHAGKVEEFIDSWIDVSFRWADSLRAE